MKKTILVIAAFVGVAAMTSCESKKSGMYVTLLGKSNTGVSAKLRNALSSSEYMGTIICDVVTPSGDTTQALVGTADFRKYPKPCGAWAVFTPGMTPRVHTVKADPLPAVQATVGPIDVPVIP